MSQPVVNKDEVIYWRHLGKSYAISVDPWLYESVLGFACRWESSEPPEEWDVKSLIEFLDDGNIKQEVRVTRPFQSEVCFCLS